MQTISRGSKGPQVLLLQRLLNKQGASPTLGEDADFGPKTQAAAVTFQTTEGITPANGNVAGTTWHKFGRLVEHQHSINLVAQPTGMSCWSAAATMMLGPVSVGAGSSERAAGGGLDTDLPNIETFVRGLGWSMINNSSMPSPSVLINGLARGPIWVAFQGAQFAHAVVLSGVWSDQADDGSGTVFRVHDPWPPGRGTIYATTYIGREIILRSSPARPHAMIQYAAAMR